MEQMLHEYTTQPAGRLTIYRCRHCGKGVARDTPPPDEACSKREAPPAPPAGAGTELSLMLSSIGIKASPNCSCRAKAREMDTRGIAWVEANIDLIAGDGGWLHQQAKARKLPYSVLVGRRLVRVAVSRAKKNPNATP